MVRAPGAGSSRLWFQWDAMACLLLVHGGTRMVMTRAAAAAPGRTPSWVAHALPRSRCHVKKKRPSNAGAAVLHQAEGTEGNMVAASTRGGLASPNPWRRRHHPLPCCDKARQTPLLSSSRVRPCHYPRPRRWTAWCWR